MSGDDPLQIRPPENAREWQDYFELRTALLRRPWGIPGEKDPDEEGSFHLAAFDGGGTVLATGRLVWKPDALAQIRSMAVAESFRGRGLGRRILRELERRALVEGVTFVFLQARELAVPFYEKCGYHIVEKSFLLQGKIQHYRMERHLHR